MRSDSPHQPSGDGWTPRRPARILLVAMIVAGLINVIQFRGIDEKTSHNFRAAQLYETGDIFEIAIARDNSARRRVAPFYFFGELFPGSVVIVPPDGIASWFPFESSMVAFGQVAEIRPAEYDAEKIVDLASLDAYRINAASFAPTTGSTVDVINDRVSYYVSDSGGEVFIVVTPEGDPGREAHISFVDIALLADDIFPLEPQS